MLKPAADAFRGSPSRAVVADAPPADPPRRHGGSSAAPRAVVHADATHRRAHVSLTFTDADAFARAIADADCEYVPLSPGPYEARLTVLELEGMRVQRAIDLPHIALGAMRPDRAALVLPVGGLQAPIMNGREVRKPGVALLPPGSGFHAVCRGRQDWASLGFGADGFAQLLEGWGAPTMPGGTRRVLRAPPGRVERLSRTVAAAADLADAEPRVLAAPGAARSLAAALRELVAEALSGLGAWAAEPRMTRDVLRVVGEADRFMRENVARPIYTDDLCAAIAVSPRRLHGAFASAYGMSPHAYLKRRRLVLVRRALRSCAPGTRLVKSVALGHGFWHLGNFAREYHAFFGEMPSDTVGKDRRRAEHVMA
jgi:AraC family transcriptional regulator, ethanolamine operon transcriptional activator